MRDSALTPDEAEDEIRIQDRTIEIHNRSESAQSFFLFQGVPSFDLFTVPETIYIQVYQASSAVNGPKGSQTFVVSGPANEDAPGKATDPVRWIYAVTGLAHTKIKSGDQLFTMDYQLLHIGDPQNSTCIMSMPDGSAPRLKIPDSSSTTSQPKISQASAPGTIRLLTDHSFSYPNEGKFRTLYW
jgi:hypothetical protein